MPNFTEIEETFCGRRTRMYGQTFERAGIYGSGGGGQAKIAMSRQGRGLRVRTDGRAGTGKPATERRDGVST